MSERIEGKESTCSQLVVIVMGSESDLDFCGKIVGVLDGFGVNWEGRVCSAHKDSVRLSEIIDEYNKSEGERVFIGVAGRQNALALAISGLTTSPVISLPVTKEGDVFAVTDLISAMRSPSGVSAPVVMFPEAAALNAISIFANSNNELKSKLSGFHDENRGKILASDEKIRR